MESHERKPSRLPHCQSTGIAISFWLLVLVALSATCHFQMYISRDVFYFLIVPAFILGIIAWTFLYRKSRPLIVAVATGLIGGIVGALVAFTAMRLLKNDSNFVTFAFIACIGGALATAACLVFIRTINYCFPVSDCMQQDEADIAR